MHIILVHDEQIHTTSMKTNQTKNRTLPIHMTHSPPTNAARFLTHQITKPTSLRITTSHLSIYRQEVRRSCLQQTLHSLVALCAPFGTAGEAVQRQEVAVGAKTPQRRAVIGWDLASYCVSITAWWVRQHVLLLLHRLIGPVHLHLQLEEALGDRQSAAPRHATAVDRCDWNRPTRSCIRRAGAFAGRSGSAARGCWEGSWAGPRTTGRSGEDRTSTFLQGAPIHSQTGSPTLPVRSRLGTVIGWTRNHPQEAPIHAQTRDNAQLACYDQEISK